MLLLLFEGRCGCQGGPALLLLLLHQVLHHGAGELLEERGGHAHRRGLTPAGQVGEESVCSVQVRVGWMRVG